MSDDIDGSDDEPITLSSHALGALHEFLAEEQDNVDKFDKLKEASERQFDDSSDPAVFDISLFKEDWNMSQFWYNDATCDFLAREVISLSNSDSVICCISTPSAYLRLRSLSPPTKSVYLFEYDKRFNVLGSSFIYYDFAKPLEFPQQAALKGKVDILLVDPPFLSEDCQTKTALTARYLSRKDGSTNVILCTGLVMQDLAKRLYSAKRTTFDPIHKGGLANEFGCFSNFEQGNIKWIDSEK